MADDVEQVGSGDNDIDLYSPKTQGKCQALATGFYCITFFVGFLCLFLRLFVCFKGVLNRQSLLNCVKIRIPANAVTFTIK